MQKCPSSWNDSHHTWFHCIHCDAGVAFSLFVWHLNNSPCFRCASHCPPLLFFLTQIPSQTLRSSISPSWSSYMIPLKNEKLMMHCLVEPVNKSISSNEKMNTQISGRYFPPTHQPCTPSPRIAHLQRSKRGGECSCNPPLRTLQPSNPL